MGSTLSGTGFFGKLLRTFKSWRAHNASRNAAALAYYSISSLAPLLVVVVVVAGYYLGKQSDLQAQILGSVQSHLGPSVAGLMSRLMSSLQRPAQGIIAMLISAGIILYGAAGILTQLQAALDEIWDVGRSRPVSAQGIIRRTLVPFGMLFVLAGMLLLSLLATSFVSTLFDTLSRILPISPIIVQAGNAVLSLVLLSLLFAVIFKLLPDTPVRWHDAVRGGALTSVLFVIGEALFNVYLRYSATTSTYGAAGSLAVFLLWTYYSSLILLFGAEYAEVESRHGQLDTPAGRTPAPIAAPSIPASAGALAKEPALVQETKSEIVRLLKKKIRRLPELAKQTPKQVFEKHPLAATSVAGATGFVLGKGLHMPHRHNGAPEETAAKNVTEKQSTAATHGIPVAAKALGVALDIAEAYLLSRRKQIQSRPPAPAAPAHDGVPPAADSTEHGPMIH